MHHTRFNSTTDNFFKKQKLFSTTTVRSANTSDVFPSQPKHANVMVVSSDEDEDDSQDGTVNYNQTGTVVNFNETTSESHHPFLSTFTQAA